MLVIIFFRVPAMNKNIHLWTFMNKLYISSSFFFVYEVEILSVPRFFKSSTFCRKGVQSMQLIDFLQKCFKTWYNCRNFKLDFCPKVLTNLVKTTSTGCWRRRRVGGARKNTTRMWFPWSRRGIFWPPFWNQRAMGSFHWELRRGSEIVLFWSLLSGSFSFNDPFNFFSFWIHPAAGFLYNVLPIQEFLRDFSLKAGLPLGLFFLIFFTQPGHGQTGFGNSTLPYLSVEGHYHCVNVLWVFFRFLSKNMVILSWVVIFFCFACGLYTYIRYKVIAA